LVACGELLIMVPVWKAGPHDLPGQREGGRTAKSYPGHGRHWREGQ